MKLTELFKTANTGLAAQIKNQSEMVTQLSRQIGGTQGPLSPFLSTPIMGDGKLMRTMGMNSNQSSRIQKRHSPNTTRVIGKKEAAAEDEILSRVDAVRKYRPQRVKELKTLAPVLLPSIVYSATKGIHDNDEKTTATRIGTLAGLGAGSGLALGGLHRLIYPNVYGPKPGQLKSLPAALATAAAGGMLGTLGTYGLAKSTSPYAEKLLYENN